MFEKLKIISTEWHRMSSSVRITLIQKCNMFQNCRVLNKEFEHSPLGFYINPAKAANFINVWMLDIHNLKAQPF